MNLSFITPSFHPAYIYGGPTVANYALCKALAMKGVRVDVITTDANGKTGLVLKKGSPVTLAEGFCATYYKEQIRNVCSLGFFRGANESIKKSDVVHIQSVFSSYALIGLYYAKKHRKPVILSSNGSLGMWSLSQGSRLKKLFLRWLVKPFAGALVFHTASDQEATDIKTLFPQARCTVIANGVEVEDCPVKTSFADPGIYLEKFTGIGAHTNPGIIVTLCRLHKVKGLEILIRAVHQLIQKKLPVVLIIAGPDFGELETLQQLVADLNLQENVFFPGELAGEEKWRFLRGADVFALPSYHENFGIAYLEALAVGVPIVASQHTPWQEVEEAGCGHWVANTPDAFSKAIESLLATGKQAVSGSARSYARRFSWDSIAQQFITAYRNSNHIT